VARPRGRRAGERPVEHGGARGVLADAQRRADARRGRGGLHAHGTEARRGEPAGVRRSNVTVVTPQA